MLEKRNQQPDTAPMNARSRNRIRCDFGNRHSIRQRGYYPPLGLAAGRMLYQAPNQSGSGNTPRSSSSSSSCFPAASLFKAQDACGLLLPTFGRL